MNPTIVRFPRTNFLLFGVLFLFSLSIIANGFLAGIATRSSISLQQIEASANPITPEPEHIKENVIPQAELPPPESTVAGASQSLQTASQDIPLSFPLKDNKQYFVKSVRVGNKAYPVSIDFEYYQFLKRGSTRTFNKEALEYVFLPKSETLTWVVDMLGKEYKDAEMAQALLEFSHNVGYKTDPYNEYWYGNNLTQFGAVTIVDSGDCLNLSILLLNLYYIAGFDAILIEFRDHAVVGIATNASGYSVTVEGKKYFIADPANFSQIGRLYPEYAGKWIMRIYKAGAITKKGIVIRVITSYQWN